MRGSHSMRIIPRKNFPQIFWRRPSLGYKALCQIRTPFHICRHHSTFLSTFPVKPSEIPVFRTSPSKWYNPSTNTRKALKSPRFELSAPLGHLPTCTPTCTQLRPDLLPTCPKYPVFQHFLDCVLANPRDFRDQLCHFARLSCIGKGLSKNMARILRGVKSPFRLLGRGGVVCFPFFPSLCQSLCRPWAFLPAILSRLRDFLGLGGAIPYPSG